MCGELHAAASIFRGSAGAGGGGVWPKKKRCEVTETWDEQREAVLLHS